MTIRATLFFMICAGMAAAGPVWRTDPLHPQLQYRVSCSREDSLTILWRNGYPGGVTLKAHVKSESYDGVEDVKIAPGGTSKSDVETMTCSLGSLNVTVVRFTMAAPPPKPVASATAAKTAPAANTDSSKTPETPPVPSLIRFDPKAEKLPEVAPELLSQIAIGMKREEVIAKLGQPASRLAIENDGAYVESYQYRVSGDKISVVRFSNGSVTEIAPPR
jgi:sulfur carrier protein ThiS